MKIECLCGGSLGRLVACTVVLLSAAPELSFSQISQPVITSIRPEPTNVLVMVRVPPGIRRVTLESRARLGAGAWVPALVAQTDGAGGVVTLRLPRGRQSEMLRVRADASQPLPATFYAGTNSFLGPPTNSAVLALGPSGASPVNGSGTTPTDNSSRAVVESDIWQFDGDTLYFFNQYRGLQVIDISNPDAATVRGLLALPAAGEQMYLAGSNHVALLAQNGCGWTTDDSQVVLVAVTNGLPQVVTNLPVPGTIQESRMVGTALYVASQTYRPVADAPDTTWEWGTVVSSFDLADADAPVSRSLLWYPGYGNVVAATDTYLFVVTQDPVNWWQSAIRIIDITAPDGTMAPYDSLRVSGQVTDKFKLNYSGEVFTSISEDWHLDDGDTLVTRLETFDLPDPRSAGPQGIVKLGELDLGDGEQLHATRFDGNLVYVVTFFQIDPLWVVDLSQPARPQIAGSVDVPGWSSYIEPLGSRLVTVGVESNRVAVSLFDVRDPANPGLLGNVLLGENYSWSEANNDEKAFTVLEDIGLVLVPYSGDTTNGWTSRVQLLDLNPTSLVARGIIEHQCEPRRAAFSHNRVLSLSAWDLLSVDATDRDKPVVNGDAELAWPVDRLFVQGDYLLEIAASTSWWGRPNETAVRVAPAEHPDQVLGELPLGVLPVVGAAVQDGRLYLAQAPASFYPLPLDGSGPSGGPPTNPPNFFLTIVDLGGLPNLSVLGSVSATIDLPVWAGASWQPVWPEPDLLVWGGGAWSWGLWPGPIPAGPVSVGPVSGGSGSGGAVSGGSVSSGPSPAGPISGGPVPGGFMPWRAGGSGSGQLLAFNVGNPAEPSFVSEVNLLTNGWWSFSGLFSVGSLVYLSHNESEQLPSPTDPAGVWVQRSYLDVIDYADPLSPTARAPVNIPGTLQGVANAGELLYTIGYHWSADPAYDWQQWLDASAYDGVAAHPVASLALTNSWPNPVLVVGANLFIGRPGYSSTTNVPPDALDTWTLPDSGAFTLLGSVVLDAPASALLQRGGLLAVQETDLSIHLFDPSAPATLLPIGQGNPAPCLYFDLGQADAALDRGLWLPLGMYGVGRVPLGHP